MVHTKETIFYNSPVGALKITALANALTALHFVSTEKYGKENEANLSYSIPVSSFLQKVVARLDDYFAGRKLVFDLVLRQSRTTFQQKVWKEWCGIKPGATLSYLQLSKARDI
jgi:methylated-DNA-[protein]-cysteine S-methyltransferase